MAGKTKIQWTQSPDGSPGMTWNPVTGCTKVSPGCDHCYAETFAERWRGIPGHPYEQGFDLKLWPERLHAPFGWRKPALVFVNSMSDLFHAKVPFEFVEQIWQTMAKTPQHTYQILTKRPDRMARFSQRLPLLPNVWLGTSIEDQERIERARHLLEARAVVRFLSIEPLLGPLYVGPVLRSSPLIQWVIVGGESGLGARPMDLRWVRNIRNDCPLGVALFVKQLGTVWARENRASDHKGGVMDEWPADLRIREMPPIGSAGTPPGPSRQDHHNGREEGVPVDPVGDRLELPLWQ